MIKNIHSHTIREDLLTPGGWVLDLGCNDFVFSRDMINRGMKVIGIDPIRSPMNYGNDLKENSSFHFINKAIVGVNTGDMIYFEYQGAGANSVYNTPDNLHDPKHGGHANNPLKTSYGVETITIAELMAEFYIDKFEYIKFDIEGAEYEIFENFPHDCTKQFSVEFHDFLSMNPLGSDDRVEEYHKALNENTLSDYSVQSERLTPLRGSKEIWNRTDTLYVENQYFDNNKIIVSV